MSFRLVFSGSLSRKRDLPKRLRNVDEAGPADKVPALGLGATPANRRQVQAQLQPREGGGRFTTNQEFLQLENEQHFGAWEGDEPTAALLDGHGHSSSESLSDTDSEEEQQEAGPASEVAYSKDLAVGYFTGLAESVQARGHLTAQQVTLWCVVAARTSNPKPCPTCSTLCEPDKIPRCTITVITWEQPVVVDLPLLWCSNC